MRESRGRVTSLQRRWSLPARRLAGIKCLRHENHFLVVRGKRNDTGFM